MADSALLASLLMGQRKRTDPNEQMRAQGQNLIVKGTSAAPVQSPLEGLARALQAGIGGFTTGLANQREEERSKKTGELLSRMMGAKTDQEIADIAKEGGGDQDVLNPLLGQMIAGNMARRQKNEAATNTYKAAGGVVPGATPSGPTVIGEPPPLPQGQPAPGGFANNLGNIRTTNLPWEGKGPPQNGFETFNTPQDGANAMFKNLGAYVKAQPNITVAQAIQKWAPPNENDTNTYITQVMEATGINPAMPLAEVLQDPAVAATLMDAMTRKEKGGLPPGVTADTFMNATTPGGTQPMTVNMSGPGGAPPQGSADGAMQPPVQQAQAPPQPQTPQAPQIAPAAAELSRQAQAAFQAGDPARAAALQQKAQEAQAAYVGEIDKERRTQDTKSYNDAQTRSQPTRQEIEKLHTARTEAATIVSALEDFRREFQNTGTFGAIKSVAGATTPVNTAYNTAALMAKGEQLFALGVLNGPDLEVIRRILPDPSTVRGATTSNADMSAAVNKVVDLIQTRLAARETQLGLPVTDVRGLANNLRATMPGGPTQQPTNGPIAPGAIEDGYRFKGGNPADKNSWERVQ